MPRYAASLLVLLVLAAMPAMAVVNTTGDVRPSAPGGFGLPIGQPGIDDDNDQIVDWIDSAGNNVFFNDADPNNPFGGAGGLAWNDPLIWVDYETTQNILVGEVGYGLLEINGGSALRYQHLVLGGPGDDTNGDLELGTTAGPDYNFLLDVNSANASRTGVGVMTITGVGSVFNNDPNVIPAEFQAALNFAAGNDIATQLNDVPDPTARDDNEGFDVHVGLLGSGQLNVLAGGRAEIQDALVVGAGSTAQGDVTVDGFGSYLAAYGRTDFDPGGNGNSTPTADITSIIGGNGRGSLTVSDGGRADFFSGLSIGAANSTTTNLAGADALNSDPLSSGEVTVTGMGSTLTVDPTAGAGLVNGAALAIGELRATAATTTRYTAGGAVIAAPDGTQALGDGRLRVETGSNVVVTGSGSAEIGYNGALELRGGRINVGGDVVNDGRIDGDGDLLAATLDTSIYSTIRGGDPNAEPGNPSAEPLRIVLAGNPGGATVAFTNRGSVEGVVDLSVTGDIDNQGRIEVGGEINARSITTTVGSSLVGNAATGSPLRIRLDSQEQITDTAPALQNSGLIGGEIELITTGGVANGDNLISNENLSNGGTIRASGTMQVGSFINHGQGLVHVEPGKTLTILKVSEADETPLSFPARINNPIQEDGIDQSNTTGNAQGGDVFMANLGSIVVDGGTFESGWVVDQRPSLTNNAIDHYRLFRNARFVEVDTGASTSNSPVGEETVGTITASDATLVFREGIYNTGVVSFAGGSNVVTGQVINAGFFRAGDDGADGMPGTPDDRLDRNGIDYDGRATEEYLRPGVILVSGDNTSVTFQDAVRNSGIISIGPNGNVANFLSDLDNTGGTIQIALSPFATDVVSAYITVAGEVRINGGSIVLNGGGGTVDPTSVSSFALATAPGDIALATAPLVPGEFSLTLLEADGELSEDSLFTSLVLPELGEGIYWDIVYDTVADEIRLELIESDAIGADFNNDNIVDQLDIDIWTRNAGIVAGASIIQGDADLDGDVDLGDYELVMQQIFAGGTPIAFAAAVPEPTALMLLCLAGVAAAAGRRG